MVHGQLISEGKVQKLSYRQVRRLEKMDRQKAREQKVLELANETIKAAGSAAEGLFAGAGFALQGFFQGDAIAFAAKLGAGYLFLNWLVLSYPNFTKTFHIDSLALTSQPEVKEVITNVSQGKNPFRNDSAGAYCRIKKNSDGSYDRSTMRCYDLAYARDSQIDPPDYVDVNRTFNSDGTVTLTEV